MELRHLRYFVAVAEDLNFRRAAERLHVAQPALSRQIKDLEGDVGVQLMYRNTAGVTLTDAGSIFLDEARDILERAEMAVAGAREAAAGTAGRLTLGNFGALSAGFLPGALSEFRNRYPRVEVNLEEMALPDQIPALQTGAIQLGFAVDQGTKLPANLESTEVLVSRIAVALGRDHLLARRSRVSLADVAQEQILCFRQSERHDMHRQRLEAIFAARGIRHRPMRPVNSLESLVALVAGDHGVSIMMPFAISPRVENIVFRRIKEDGEDLQLRLSAVWRKSGGSRLALNFVEVLRGLSRKAPRA